MKERFDLKKTIPLIYFLTSMSITLLAWFFISRSFELNRQSNFNALSLQVKNDIQTRMETYVNALTQTRSMFYVTREVDRKEFKDYVKNLNLLEKYPGIQGLGYAEKITKENLPKFVKLIRSQGFENFKIWPENEKNIYFPVVYIEPFNWRNKRALGFDLSSDPIRLAAMDKARDTGLPAITQRVKLVQETAKNPQYGFLIFIPIYKLDTSLESIEDRRSAHLGYISEPFRARNLFEHIFSTHKGNHPLDIEVYLGANSSSSLIYDSHPEMNQQNNPSEFIKQYVLDMAQGRWIVKVQATAAFELQNFSLIPLLFLMMGMILSFLIYWLSHNQRKNAFGDKEKALQFETLYKVGRALSAELGLEKLVQAVTDAGLELSKAQFGAFFYTISDDKGQLLTLYTLSGARKEDFSKFPLPRNTEVFGPTFRNEGTVISDNITTDPRYGKNPPFKGLPAGHLPVKSYLAVSVVSRTGQVIGGLFYGHEKEGIFSSREQKFVEGIASQAAIGIDNARLYQESIKAIQTREDFLSIASHELKTPVTSMKLQFQMAKRMIENGNEKVYSPQAVNRRVTLADVQLSRMSKLIDDMLDSSRISSSQLNIQKLPLDICQLVEGIIERFQEQLDVLKIKVNFAKCLSKIEILGDSFRLEQVFTNLMSNALKYGEGGSIEVRIEITSTEIFVIFQDNGLGIAKESLAKIFNRFERASDATNISGLGLGLYISQIIVKAHSGEILVESELGKGSTFKVKLPWKTP